MQKGFSLLELVIAVSILTLVGALVLVSFINSRNVRDLDSYGQNILSVLQLAQSRALAGEANTIWGVHLEQSQVVLFRDVYYFGGNFNEYYTLPNNLEIVSVALAGGGQEVIFNRLDGKTAESGSFVLRVKDSTSNTFPVTIDPSGKVFRTGTSPSPSNTRLVDTRHRTYILAGTIQNSTVMKLTFSDPPNPDTITSINMSPLAPRTTFDWTGTAVVGGQNQTMRIHALLVSPDTTTLSVDRDCRKNTKKVRISFDANDVVTYEADCQNITLGLFASTVTEP